MLFSSCALLFSLPLALTSPTTDSGKRGARDVLADLLADPGKHGLGDLSPEAVGQIEQFGKRVAADTSLCDAAVSFWSC